MYRQLRLRVPSNSSDEATCHHAQVYAHEAQDDLSERIQERPYEVAVRDQPQRFVAVGRERRVAAEDADGDEVPRADGERAALHQNEHDADEKRPRDVNEERAPWKIGAEERGEPGADQIPGRSPDGPTDSDEKDVQRPLPIPEVSADGFGAIRPLAQEPKDHP